ncbi:hypothetical protein ABN128_28230, partial [Klebsiella variicola subsp. variicola]
KACVLPENPASYRVVRKKSYLFNKAHKLLDTREGGDWQNLSNRCRLRRVSAPLTFRAPSNISWRLSKAITVQYHLNSKF